MKTASKLLCFILIVSLHVFAFSQSNYQAELKKLNDYLKTFDNGYYGYFEVKDNYLWGRFPSGKYTKTPIDKLGPATMTETNRKVQVFCKEKQKCVYSTHTDSYHDVLSFSQSTDFKTGELITLLNNLINALQNKNTISSTSSSNAANLARLEREKEAPKPQPVVTPSQSPTIDRSNYLKQLNALNSYLKTFNPETYGDAEVKDGKVYFNFKVGTQTFNSYITISDLTQNTSIFKANSFGSEEIKILCKGDSKCFYSTYSKGYADHFRFFSNTVKDLTKMKQLVDDLVNAMK